MLKTYAPIILFTYNRPKHTIQTIQALSANPLALKSDLYIYQDAPKPNASKDILQSHTQTKNYIQDFITNNTQKPLFKSITFIEREYNLGLADSIIDGVSFVINKHEKAIILEDDIIVSPVFLDYMNAALQRYENEPKVWSIAAWSYPIDTSGLGDCYFWRLPHCWGWATWASRWQYYKRDITWALENFSQSDIDYINIDGVAHYYDHLLANAQGKIKTWAIFNYLIGYKHNALNLCPSTSYIKQIGFDGSGVHCGQEGEVFNTSHINTKFPITFPQEIIESPLALERIKAFELSLKKPLPLRIYKKLRRITHSLSQKVSYLSGGGVVNNILALDTPPYYEKGA
ncbi:hypothetical protein [Helicobacter japonicus]|uniref:alpha-1,3-mannosyl-glycoprotein 2-beta-N-acetylglucosaminyltransferase n=14 Tax=Helicobacter japonicus TaxID=425400 RepID=A0A4U8TPE1_9HELI|nr:hypothetical protein [Helicobacter japonicus]TLE01946.1 sugar transferase [Helicobacter japonicus]